MNDYFGTGMRLYFEKLVDFEDMGALIQWNAFNVTAHPDGRFVYLAEPAGGPDPHLHVVVNFDAELNARLSPQSAP